MPDDRLASYAAAKRLRAATAARLRDLGADACAALLDLAEPLAMNDNHLRDVLDLVEDTAARRGIAPAEVLADPVIAAAGAVPGGRSDRIRALKACLRRLRYPQLTAALDRVAALRDAMELPAGVRLEVPENLEGDELVVRIGAASAAQLRDRVGALARALEGEQLDSIFAIWQEAEG